MVKFKVKNGYKHFADSGKPVHRHVAERMLGRKLKQGEVVHHKNRNKLDNRRSNLYVCKNQKQHDYFHNIDAKKHGKKASYKGFKNKPKIKFDIGVEVEGDTSAEPPFLREILQGIYQIADYYKNKKKK